MMIESEEIPMNLAKIKFEKGWKTSQLAQELGISLIWVRLLLNGKGKPSVDIIQRIQLTLEKLEIEPWKKKE